MSFKSCTSLGLSHFMENIFSLYNNRAFICYICCLLSHFSGVFFFSFFENRVLFLEKTSLLEPEHTCRFKNCFFVERTLLKHQFKTWPSVSTLGMIYETLPYLAHTHTDKHTCIQRDVWFRHNRSVVLDRPSGKLVWPGSMV